MSRMKTYDGTHTKTTTFSSRVIALILCSTSLLVYGCDTPLEAFWHIGMSVNAHSILLDASSGGREQNMYLA